MPRAKKDLCLPRPVAEWPPICIESTMNQRLRKYFDLFNEIGIIAQLTRTLMEDRLPSGVTQPHFSVLNHLVRLGDGVTPRDLARAFQVPKNSMTNTLSGLEERGLIEIRPNPDDARSKRIYLTPAGKAFREKSIDALSVDLQQIATKIRVGDIDALLPTLRHVRQVLDDNRGSNREG